MLDSVMVAGSPRHLSACLPLAQVPGPYCRNLDEVPQPAQDTKGAPKGAHPSAHAPKGEGGQKGAQKG